MATTATILCRNPQSHAVDRISMLDVRTVMVTTIAASSVPHVFVWPMTIVVVVVRDNECPSLPRQALCKVT